MSSASFSRMVKWPTIILSIPRVLLYALGWDLPEPVRMVVELVDSICVFGLTLGERLADIWLSSVPDAPVQPDLSGLGDDALIIGNLIVTACVALNLFVYLYVIMRFADYRLAENSIGPSMRDLDKYQNSRAAIRTASGSNAQSAATSPQSGLGTGAGFWSSLKRSSALARIETELKPLEPETINHPVALRRGAAVHFKLREYAAARLQAALKERGSKGRPSPEEIIDFLSKQENCLCRIEDGVIAVYGTDSGKQVYAGSANNVIAYLNQVRKMIDDSAARLAA